MIANLGVYINICYIPFIKFFEKKCESQWDEVGPGLNLGSFIIPRRKKARFHFSGLEVCFLLVFWEIHVNS